MYLTVDSFSILRKVNVKSYGYDKMFMIHSVEEKSNIGIFIFHYSTIYINFMMEMEEIAKYYLLPFSLRGYNFNKASSITN